MLTRFRFWLSDMLFSMGHAIRPARHGGIGGPGAADARHGGIGGPGAAD